MAVDVLSDSGGSGNKKKSNTPLKIVAVLLALIGGGLVYFGYFDKDEVAAVFVPEVVGEVADRSVADQVSVSEEVSVSDSLTAKEVESKLMFEARMAKLAAEAALVMDAKEVTITRTHSRREAVTRHIDQVFFISNFMIDKWRVVCDSVITVMADGIDDDIVRQVRQNLALKKDTMEYMYVQMLKQAKMNYKNDLEVIDGKP